MTEVTLTQLIPSEITTLCTSKTEKPSHYGTDTSPYKYQLVLGLPPIDMLRLVCNDNETPMDRPQVDALVILNNLSGEDGNRMENKVGEYLNYYADSRDVIFDQTRVVMLNILPTTKTLSQNLLNEITSYMDIRMRGNRHKPSLLTSCMNAAYAGK